MTGRSHQIRVHLQFLGFPIVNDPIYNHASAWGESLGKGGFRIEAPHKLSTQAEAGGPGEEAFLAAMTNGDNPVASTSKISPLSESLSDADPRKKRLAKKEKHALRSASKIGRGKYQGLNTPALAEPIDPDSPDAGNSSSIEITDDVRKVILELRSTKDSEDNFARRKDETYADRMAWVRTADEQESPAGDVVQDAEGDYCGKCGLPLLPDPRPDQLFIYLHALRSVPSPLNLWLGQILSFHEQISYRHLGLQL